MSGVNRRFVLGGLTMAGAMSFAAPAMARGEPKVVIIGGGFGGASAAMHLRKIAPKIKVTLIEPNKKYFPCPFTNLTITHSQLPLRAFDFTHIRNSGINVIHQHAIQIDPEEKQVTLSRGDVVYYDRLILSPGIDFIWDAIENYDENAAKVMPHGWKAGMQTVSLQNKLNNLPDGGTIAISIPPPPFRCPPGPYERASLMADYLKKHKPKSKLLILDAQDKFSKQPLFEEAWAEYFPNIIERIPGSESGSVVRVDTENNTLHTDFDSFKVDLANVIPPQRAGLIAKVAGVTNATGWCPINAVTFESSLVPNIHVIGDATIANPMPKSAFSANQQAKVCAAQIALLLSGKAPIPTTLLNTCFSFTDRENAFSVSGVYLNKGGTFSSVPGAGGTSPLGNHPELRQSEAQHAKDWFANISREAFGY